MLIFCEFFIRNIKQLKNANSYPVHFTGGVAWHFKSVLNNAAIETGHQIGNISLSPIDGLLLYHKNNKLFYDEDN